MSDDANSNALQLRDVHDADFPQWVHLWSAYNAFYGRSGADALPTSVSTATRRRFLDPAEPMFAVVAVCGSQVVGLAHYLYHLSTTSITPVCYLRDLYTLPAARGGGIATALIDRVCDEARRSGLPRIYWQTHEDNQAARRLYDNVAQQSGFLIYQKFMRPSDNDKGD